MLDTPHPAPDLSAEPQQRQRKIIHIDMDAFYASVEQRDDPALRGKPVAVGGSRERGVVAAASYEARRFGVRSAMSGITARRLCPELIFVRPRFDVYKAVSQQIRAVFAEHTPIIEPLSLDEAYLDVTENLQGIATATQIARAIRASIREQTGLTASAGVSYNKFLAKLASDHRKPDGLFVIPPGRGAAFVEHLDVGRFHGVSPVTAAKMRIPTKSAGVSGFFRCFGASGSNVARSVARYCWHHRGLKPRLVPFPPAADPGHPPCRAGPACTRPHHSPHRAQAVWQRLPALRHGLQPDAQPLHPQSYVRTCVTTV